MWKWCWNHELHTAFREFAPTHHITLPIVKFDRWSGVMRGWCVCVLNARSPDPCDSLMTTGTTTAPHTASWADGQDEAWARWRACGARVSAQHPFRRTHSLARPRRVNAAWSSRETEAGRASRRPCS
jgi:hypothetical protein